MYCQHVKQYYFEQTMHDEDSIFFTDKKMHW